VTSRDLYGFARSCRNNKHARHTRAEFRRSYKFEDWVEQLLTELKIKTVAFLFYSDFCWISVKNRDVSKSICAERGHFYEYLFGLVKDTVVRGIERIPILAGIADLTKDQFQD